MEHVFLTRSIHRRNQRGFTLLEVLIVIAIIGILVSIGVASYSSAQQKSRDARRKGDLKAVQNAFEQYNADNDGNYPVTCSVDSTYMPVGMPADPKDPTDTYQTASGCTATSYCFCADVEVDTQANSDNNCNFSAASKTHYCVSALQ